MPAKGFKSYQGVAREVTHMPCKRDSKRKSALLVHPPGLGCSVSIAPEPCEIASGLAVKPGPLPYAYPPGLWGIQPGSAFLASPPGLKPPGKVAPHEEEQSERDVSSILNCLAKHLDNRIEALTTSEHFDTNLSSLHPLDEGSKYASSSSHALEDMVGSGVDSSYFGQTVSPQKEWWVTADWRQASPTNFFAANGYEAGNTNCLVTEQCSRKPDWAHNFEGHVMGTSAGEFRDELTADNVQADSFEKAEPPGSPTMSTCTVEESISESSWTNSAELDNFYPGSSLCKWDHSAESVGKLSHDGHVFTKMAGGEKVRLMPSGSHQKLSTICMVYDERLRCCGTHRYHYQVLNGEIGAADGAGFVFDSKVRRNNLQCMRSIFMNSRGQICFRNRQHVQKLNATLPRMQVGMRLVLTVDLDALCLDFALLYADGTESGRAVISLNSILGNQCLDNGWQYWQSGFFCALVTKEISVLLE